jgi:ATP-dependent Clp protease protease subunit
VLLDRRLDAAAANAAVAQLLLLDAEDQQAPIRVVVNSAGGDLGAALAVHDVMQRCAAPIETLCIGEAAGAAALALSGGTPRRRAILPTARVRLELGAVERSGNVGDVQAWARELEALTFRFAQALARDCGRHAEEVEHDLHRGRVLDASAAVAYGIADTVAGEQRVS